jgi:uncharacterized protein (TIGR00369 family)
MSDDAAFIFGEDPGHPGWHSWKLSDDTRYNGFLGPLLVRREGEMARIRMMPEHKHSNLSGAVHGGTTLGFIDVALFGASRVFGLIDAGTAVTLDLSVQFIGAGKTSVLMEAEVELLRETRRLLFLRGLVTQGDEKVAAFSGTIRKPTAR